jgi:hypothetical protein
MPRDFFDPTPEEQKVFLVNAATVSEAENLIKSCEQCNPEMEIRFAALPILLHGSRNMYPSKAPCSMGRSPALTKLRADQASLLLLLIWRRVLHIDRRRKVREWVVAKYEPFNPILMFTK